MTIRTLLLCHFLANSAPGLSHCGVLWPGLLQEPTGRPRAALMAFFFSPADMCEGGKIAGQNCTNAPPFCGGFSELSGLRFFESAAQMICLPTMYATAGRCNSGRKKEAKNRPCGAKLDKHDNHNARIPLNPLSAGQVVDPGVH